MVDSIVTWFFKNRQQVKEITWFRTALYAFLLYKAFIYVYHFKSLFSEDKMIYNRPVFSNSVKDLVFVLNNYYSKTLCIACILLLVLLALTGLLKKSNYLSDILLWLVMLNMNSFLYATLTAGDYLLNQLLFFNLFFSTKAISGSPENDLRTAFHNMALIGIKIQVCLVYGLSSWFKLTDTEWLNGTAVYHIFQIPEYTSSWLSGLPLCICLIINYATLLYQLIFPVAIWFRPFKIYLLAFGLIQHVIIAFEMGLFSFGIIMILCYLLFLQYDYDSKLPVESDKLH